MNAWPPQASYPCGNFSDTSCWKLSKPKGSIGRAFAVPMRTEHRDQASFCPFAPREVSVLAELALGHLRYSLTDVPPQSNSPPGSVLESDHAGHECGRDSTGEKRERPSPAENKRAGSARGAPVPALTRKEEREAQAPTGRPLPQPQIESAWRENTVTPGQRVAYDARAPPNRVSKETMKVVVFHWRRDPRRRTRLPLMLHLSCLLTVPD